MRPHVRLSVGKSVGRSVCHSLAFVIVIFSRAGYSLRGRPPHVIFQRKVGKGQLKCLHMQYKYNKYICTRSVNVDFLHMQIYVCV